MNEVDYFVFESIINWPLLFKTRARVLAHSLLVIGNGIDWNSDGTIRYEKNDPRRGRRHYKTIEAALKGHKEELELDLANVDKGENESPTAWIREHKKESLQRMYDENVEVIKNADVLAVTKCPPLSKDSTAYYEGEVDTVYANFFNAPENVSDAWLDAMHEVVDYIREMNPYVKDVYEPFLKKFNKG